MPEQMSEFKYTWKWMGCSRDRCRDPKVISSAQASQFPMHQAGELGHALIDPTTHPSLVIHGPKKLTLIRIYIRH